MNVSMYGYSATGDRHENEDSFACGQPTEDFAYAVICDGLGGHGGGKTASAIGVAALSQCTEAPGLPQPQDILHWIDQANVSILNIRLNENHMKTTAVALYLQGNQALWVHVGDTRLYHFYNGVLDSVTVDHSLGQIAVMVGDITHDQIPEYPGRSTLTQAIGTEAVNPTLHPATTLGPGFHAFLLCSDGLWERLSDAQIGQALLQSPHPEAWVTTLRTLADAKKKTDIDNNTAIAVFLKE